MGRRSLEGWLVVGLGMLAVVAVACTGGSDIRELEALIRANGTNAFAVT